MSPRIALVATVAATVLSLAAPALASAVSPVTSPADGSAYAYAETAPPEVTVSGIASGPVDLRCAATVGSSWSFGTLLTGGDNVPITGGTFTAGPVVLPTDDAALCRLVAVPHGTTPTDLTGISGPNLRLLIVRNTGAQTDGHSGVNQGTPFNHFTTAGGTVADTGYTAAGNTGIDSMSLLSSDPGEMGRIFNNAGNAVVRIWRLASADGRAHDVKLWIAHAAASNGVLSRAWKLPGDTSYATRSDGDAPATTGAAPWIARFNSVGAADGDASQGVGAVAASAVPSALRFASARELDAKYPLAVPAVGDAELRFVYVGAATQAALESDLAAALATVNGGGGTGGGGPGGDDGSSVGVPSPKLTRTGKAVLGTNDTLALGYALGCPAMGVAPPCYATVTVTQPVSRRRRANTHKSAKRRSAARRARPRVLGTVQVQVAPGRSVALKLRVARKNRAAFKAGHVTMTARLDRTGAATQTVVKPLSVKIAEPKPRRRAHHRR